MVYLNIELNYLDIGSEFREMSNKFLRILLYSLNEYLPPISRDPDEMVLGLIYRVGTLPKFHAPLLADNLSSG
jgi:hypothetical protein